MNIIPGHKYQTIDTHVTFFSTTFDRNVGRKIKHTITAFIFIVLQFCYKITVGSITRTRSFNFNNLNPNSSNKNDLNSENNYTYTFIFDVIDDVTIFFIFFHFFIKCFCFRCDSNSGCLNDN